MHAPQMGLLTNLSPCQRQLSKDSHHDYNCAAATSSKHHCQMVIQDRIIWKANHTQSRKDLPQVEIRLVCFCFMWNNISISCLGEVVFKGAWRIQRLLLVAVSIAPISASIFVLFIVCIQQKRYCCHGVSRFYFMFIDNPPRPSPKHLRGTRRAGADSCFRFITRVDYPS